MQVTSENSRGRLTVFSHGLNCKLHVAWFWGCKQKKLPSERRVALVIVVAGLNKTSVELCRSSKPFCVMVSVSVLCVSYRIVSALSVFPSEGTFFRKLSRGK